MQYDCLCASLVLRRLPRARPSRLNDMGMRDKQKIRAERPRLELFRQWRFSLTAPNFYYYRSITVRVLGGIKRLFN